MPEPVGPGVEGDVTADDTDLDIADAIAQQVVDLTLNPPFQGRLGRRVGAGLDRDRRLLVGALGEEKGAGRKRPRMPGDRRMREGVGDRAGGVGVVLGVVEGPGTVGKGSGIDSRLRGTGASKGPTTVAGTGRTPWLWVKPRDRSGGENPRNSSVRPDDKEGSGSDAERPAR